MGSSIEHTQPLWENVSLILISPMGEISPSTNDAISPVSRPIIRNLDKSHKTTSGARGRVPTLTAEANA